MQLPTTNRATRDYIILGFVSLVLFIIKFDEFFLPHFWDDAWSYIPAVHAMADKGPSLLPNAISPWLYRGHPLFFYFLVSSWMVVFGESLFVIKLLPFILSIAFLYATYSLLSKAFSRTVGLASAIMLSVQSVFVTQSTFVLPEILLALLSVLALYSFISKNKFGTVIWLTIALFTKETAIVIYGVIGLSQIYFFARSGKKATFKNLFNELAYLALPAIMIGLFFVLQKHIVGWYLFPNHLNYIDVSLFQSKFLKVLSYIFIDTGMVTLSRLGILCFLVFTLLIKKTDRAKIEHLIIFVLFITVYSIFSGLNFFTHRYIISVLPFSIGILSFIIVEAITQLTKLRAIQKKHPIHGIYKNVAFLIVFTIPTIVIGVDTFTKTSIGDCSLGYRDMVTCSKKAVEYLENNYMKDKHITTHFLMTFYLKDPNVGYLTQKKGFEHISTSLNEKTEIVVISKIERNKKMIKKVKQENAELLKRFKQGQAWTEIYKFPNESGSKQENSNTK